MQWAWGFIQSVAPRGNRPIRRAVGKEGVGPALGGTFVSRSGSSVYPEGRAGCETGWTGLPTSPLEQLRPRPLSPQDGGWSRSQDPASVPAPRPLCICSPE
ncbi:hypothetical protein P7K49_033767 [Saguinus oedipus]|uniref:Uncharacterized protein n=1 Tax=Saguinus oedipus TaxID=9490 RepID=A0ABQ9TSV4_SAGOE|nr:hypothetical protein P7K49_033767 [Saguinus oedipus]